LQIWQVSVHARQRIDCHGPVGSTAAVDLVVRGDKFARRARAFASCSIDSVSFAPTVPFQLTPGAFNRISLRFAPRAIGTRRLQVNLVDVDSKELISAWSLTTTATSPAIARAYDIQALIGAASNKKLLFTSPWSFPCRYVLSSSDETIVKPRQATLEMPPGGSAYVRLWVGAKRRDDDGPKEVFLFLNSDDGANEETILLRVL